jgi:putative transposase
MPRKAGQVWVPKVGWVRFRWSGPVPPVAKSYRVTLVQAGRWHIAFTAIPDPILAPGNGRAGGVDRGVVVGAALSTGELLSVPGLTARERKRRRRLERKLAWARRGSSRRRCVRLAFARLRARETDRRKDWAEKASTDLARRFDLIRVEKAPGRVEKINPAYTSQRCSACGHVDAKSRESQARFVYTACGFVCHADVNAARNIAAGHAVTARGDDEATRPVNREPQLLLQSA